MKSKIILFSIVLMLVLSSLALGTLLVTNNAQFDKDPAFYKSLGNEMIKKGEFAKATAAYEESLKLAEDYNIRNNLAVIYYQNQKYTYAITHLRVLVAHEATNPSYHYDLAVNLVDKFRNTDDKKLEDLQEALSEYETANELSPGYANSVSNIEVLKRVLEIE